jgi:hypothetical protein
LYKYQVTNETTSSTEFLSKSLGGCSCANNGKCINKKECDREWPYSQIKENGKKWVITLGIYASVGHSNTLTAYDIHTGKWKRKTRKQICTFIDQYYELEYWFAGNGGGSSTNPILHTNHNYVTIDSDISIFVIDHSVSIFANVKNHFCVPTFGRTHNWSYN